MTAEPDIVDRLRQSLGSMDDACDGCIPEECGDKMVATIANEAAGEIEALRSWKAEATEVIASWEQVWEALGQPGDLGESKAAAVQREVERLRSAIEAAVSDLATHAVEHRDGTTLDICVRLITANRAEGAVDAEATEKKAAAVLRAVGSESGRSDQ